MSLGVGGTGSIRHTAPWSKGSLKSHNFNTFDSNAARRKICNKRDFSNFSSLKWGYLNVLGELVYFVKTNKLRDGDRPHTRPASQLSERLVSTQVRLREVKLELLGDAFDEPLDSTARSTNRALRPHSFHSSTHSSTITKQNDLKTIMWVFCD